MPRLHENVCRKNIQIFLFQRSNRTFDDRYGRYSNSIQIDKYGELHHSSFPLLYFSFLIHSLHILFLSHSGCGVCKSRLVPLFTVRTPKAPPTQAEPETPVMTLSRMAGKPRGMHEQLLFFSPSGSWLMRGLDSPQSIPPPSASSVATGAPSFSRLPLPSRQVHYEDSDSDIEILATNFTTIAIAQRDSQ